uniref:MarR family transcriptional regulator n=1 Tax=Geoglobus ahangari TaxID=113653 RepID=A0A7C4WCZ4_9EURY
MEIRDQILKLLGERGSVLQKDLWKELNIDSSKCSRILRKLEKEGLVKRIEIVVDGVKTFKIVPAGAEEVVEKEDLTLIEIMQKFEDITGLPPCFGCREVDCDSNECIKIEVWFLRKTTLG